MSDPIRTRVRWRIRNSVRAALLRAFGRPVRCAACGRPLCRVRPVMWRGRVKLLGVAETEVRVAFGSRTDLEFRHVELDRCPAPERPWVR